MVSRREESGLDDGNAATIAELCRAYPDLAGSLERAGEAARSLDAGAAISPLAVARLLADLGADGTTVVAALLGTPELAAAEPEQELPDRYGEGVARLVRNVRWLNSFREHDKRERAFEPAERLRRMILAMAEDVRAVLVRLAYRTCRMRTLARETQVDHERIARETLDLYAPLANRLGVSRLKWELEDLAFRNLMPDTYARIANGLAERRESREAFVETFTRAVRAALVEDGLATVEVFGRPKHIYSIWKKMQRKHVDFDRVFDVHAVRILVERVQDCYTALGSVHGRWPHIPDEFDDYIAKPKGNGYQSLHTAVIGPGGRPVEVQIRTRQMNEHAERGVAAHWMYKEGSSEGERLQHSINELRALLDSGEDALAESLGGELFADRVFVFTPAGDVVDLPQGATVLDFAFAIHSDVGFRCRGGKIDGRIVPLTHVLRNGEQVEILTAREAQPSREWLSRDLGYLGTGRARAKVRAWFNRQDHSQHVAAGKAALERELRRLNATGIDARQLARETGHDSIDAMHAALGRGELSGARIAGAVERLTRPAAADTAAVSRPRAPAEQPGDALQIQGVGNVLTRVANCCKPVPGDDIVGYITRGRGVTVHRSDCRNMLHLGESDRQRLVEVAWGSPDPRQAWSVDIRVDALDRQGLLRDISQVLSDNGVNITRADMAAPDREQRIRVDMRIEIRDMDQLNRALLRIEQLPNVLEARRDR